VPRYGHIADVFLKNIADKLDTLNTSISKITSTVARKPFSLTFTAAGDQAVWTPASGKKIRLHFISFESDADVAVGWRFGTTETVQVCRITKGVYAVNFIGANQEGATDQALNIRAEGAVNVKGYVLGQEV
jgi:hypothetical protein